MFFSGAFIATPVVGPVVGLGFLASTVISAVEGAIAIGGLSALGAALFSIGIPKDSVIDYETALKADNFLVMAHGTGVDMGRAKSILDTVNPVRIETHAGISAPAPVDQPAFARSEATVPA